MKDVIEEQRKHLLEYFTTNGCNADWKYHVNQAFLAVANQADFISSRLQGEAGIIDRAAEKIPRMAELLRAQAKIMRGYAARIENSQAPEFQQPQPNLIIRPGGNGL